VNYTRFRDWLREWFFTRLPVALRREKWLEAVPDLKPSIRVVNEPEPDDDRRKQRHRKKLALGFIQSLDDVADSVFDYSKRNPRYARQFTNQFGWVDVSLSHDLSTALEKYSDVNFESYCGMPKDDLSDVDASLVTNFVDDETGDCEEGWIIHRIRRVSFREIRSRTPLFVPGATWILHEAATDMFKMEYTYWLYLTRDRGKTWHCCWMEGYRKGHRGHARVAPITERKKGDDRFWCWDTMIRAATRQRLIDDCVWDLRMQRGPVQFRFPCEDAVARELLSLRDLAEGKRRRDAARHWVRAHLRKRADGGVSIVRPHLRGAMEFDWGRWHCSLSEVGFDRRAYDSRVLPTADPLKRQKDVIGLSEPSRFAQDNSTEIAV
jgi:hypothetical protein